MIKINQIKGDANTIEINGERMAAVFYADSDGDKVAIFRRATVIKAVESHFKNLYVNGEQPASAADAVIKLNRFVGLGLGFNQGGDNPSTPVFNSNLKITDSDGVETTFGLLKLGEKIPLKLRIVSDQEDELSEVDKVQINGNVYLLVYDFHWNFLGTEGITLTSSNPSVATISDDGIIAGISDGTVTFKAVRNSDGAVGETQAIKVESLRITLSEFEDSQIPEIDVIFLDYPTYVWIWDIDGNLVDPLECELELWDRDFDMSESISPEGKITMGGWAMYGGPMTVIATRKVGGVGVGSKTVNLA